MKVFLDDERSTPDGWIRAYWPDEVIRLLQAGQVEVLSLDHDLGDDSRGTGYDVILWMETEVALHGFSPPLILIHSANSAAAQRMRAGVESIARLASRQSFANLKVKFYEEEIVTVRGGVQNSLNSLYEKFKNEVSLPAELAERASPPLLLSVSDKWVNAEKRVLVVGQETLGWDFHPGDYFPDLKDPIMTFADFQVTPNSVAALTAGYRDFEFARHQPGNYNSPFWRAYRSVRSSLGEDVDGAETAVLWTNLFRMSLDNGSVYENGSSEEAALIREAGSALLRAEIQVLAPTSVIFFTGPNYNEHLYAQFPGVEPFNLESYEPEKTSMLKHPLLPIRTFRTYHPAYLARSGQWGIISEINAWNQETA